MARAVDPVVVATHTLGRQGPAQVLSDVECAAVIAASEEAAARRGGWTTARHYAVPTTDLPVHEDPVLLRWFRSLMRQRLGPLLERQWGTACVGERGSGCRTFDAFIVKYDSSRGQRHLPVHRDQSTHSFTIALNAPGEEFTGGGTYLCDLGAAISPARGHLLSFEGNLLHGGDPVTNGIRYIAVAFTYAEHAAAAAAESPLPLPRKRPCQRPGVAASLFGALSTHTGGPDADKPTFSFDF